MFLANGDYTTCYHSVHAEKILQAAGSILSSAQYLWTTCKDNIIAMRRVETVVKLIDCMRSHFAGRDTLYFPSRSASGNLREVLTRTQRRHVMPLGVQCICASESWQKTFTARASAAEGHRSRRNGPHHQANILPLHSIGEYGRQGGGLLELDRDKARGNELTVCPGIGFLGAYMTMRRRQQ